MKISFGESSIKGTGWDFEENLTMALEMAHWTIQMQLEDHSAKIHKDTMLVGSTKHECGWVGVRARPTKSGLLAG